LRKRNKDFVRLGRISIIIIPSAAVRRGELDFETKFAHHAKLWFKIFIKSA